MEENKNMNFNETEATANEAAENNEATNENKIVIVKKPGLFGWFSGLKTWQKIAIGGTVLVVAIVGGRKVVQVLSKNGEVVAEGGDELIKAAQEAATDTVETGEVVNF